MRLLLERDSLEQKISRLTILRYKLMENEPLTSKERILVEEDLLWVQELLVKATEHQINPLTIRSF